MNRITGHQATEIIQRPGVRETFYGNRTVDLPDDPSIVYLEVEGGVVIFSPLNSATHILHVAFMPGHRKGSAKKLREAINWFHEQGGRCVIALIPKAHRAAVGLAWNTKFTLCGRIKNGCEHGDLLIFEDSLWVS